MTSANRFLKPVARLLGAAAFLSASAAGAQAPAASPAPVPIPTLTAISFNPLGLPFDIGTFEIESAVAPGITIGGVASYIADDDDRFTTGDFKVRYYPGEVVLRGFSVGGSIGLTRFSKVVTDVRQSVTAPTVGIITDYNWLLGRSQHFLIGTGVGAKRVLASRDDRDRVDIDRAVFTARFVLGFAF